MEVVLRYWLTIAVCIFLLVKILRGHYLGFARKAVSLTALIASICIVNVGTPYITSYLRANTGIYQVIGDGVKELLGMRAELTSEEIMPARQREMIEQLNLPAEIKTLLIQNNNNEVYQILGIERFYDYISEYVCNIVIRTAVLILLFLLSYVIIRLLFGWVNIISKIPVLSSINQIAGTIIGLVEGLATIWLLTLGVTLCSNTGWGIIVMEQVNQSPLLLLLYHNNPFQWVLLSIIGSVIK